MKINMIESKEKRETRKCFKYEKESHIKQFYRIKLKKTILVTFDTSKNEKVLKTKRNQDSKI